MEFATVVGGKLVLIAVDAIIEAVQGRPVTDEEREQFLQRISAANVQPYHDVFPENPNRNN